VPCETEAKAKAKTAEKAGSLLVTLIVFSLVVLSAQLKQAQLPLSSLKRLDPTSVTRYPISIRRMTISILSSPMSFVYPISISRMTISI